LNKELLTKKTLLHILPFAFIGGTEKDCYYLIQAGKEYKHEVIVLNATGPMVKQWESEGAKVSSLNILDLPTHQWTKKIAGYIGDKNFAGIFYWSTINLPVIRYALKYQKCKLAVHVGNPSQLGKLSILKHILFHTFFHSRIETCLFACSQHVRNTLIKNNYYKQFESRVSLNPVRLLDENPYKARLLDEKSEIILGMTARLDPIKDHETLIKAFSFLIKEYPNAKLWLFGDGVLKEQLKLLVKDLKIDSNVVFWGNVNDIYRMLQKLDIFVYATTSREGLGNAVSEAMANGLPCVIPNLGMMHEIAGNFEAALFYEPKNSNHFAEQMIYIIENKEARMKLSKNAFNRAKLAFSAERYVNERLQFLLA
jgi:glycosyltransferase involved in cell wall biosynthesis